MRNFWTKEDERLLIDNRPFLTIKQLTLKLNRTEKAVRTKLQKLGLTKTSDIRKGKKFNSFTIIGKINGSNVIYACTCTCGKTVEISRYRLSGKNSIKSCGCHKKFGKILIDIKSVTPDLYSFRYLFSRYLRGADRRSVVFELSFEQFIEISKKNCFYCGIEPRPYNAAQVCKKLKYPVEDYWINANGVDRIDNDLGYTASNVVTCCKECNYSKRDMSAEEWKKYLNRIYNFMKLASED